MYNITNNNNINYNYGSNVTAIGSDGMAGGSGGSVPTFHEIDKAKKTADGSSTFGDMLGSVNLGGALTSIQKSKGLAKIGDKIKRTTGVNVSSYIGTKTMVDKAEERLRKDNEG